MSTDARPSPDTLSELSIRRKKIEKFLESKNASDVGVVFKEFICKNDRAAQRILAILKGDQYISDANPCFSEVFETFCEIVPAWLPLLQSVQSMVSPSSKHLKTSVSSTPSTAVPIRSTSIVAFWESVLSFSAVQEPYFNVNHFLILRQQLLGNCYLHSVIAMEHYLVSLGTECNDVNMVNMGLWERDVAITNQEELKEFLTKSGGNSFQELRVLCNLIRSEIENIHPKEVDKLFERVASKPLLVHSFEVYPAFLDKTKFSFGADDIEPGERGKVSPLHAMLIIGARKVDDAKEGGCFFVMQNWWSSKFFVEVSATYLQHCVITGIISVIPTLSSRNPIYPTILSEFAESALELDEEDNEDL